MFGDVVQYEAKAPTRVFSLKEALNILTKIGMHFHKIFTDGWLVCLAMIVNTTICENKCPNHRHHRLHVWRWLDVYSPASVFYLRRSYWESWKRLNIWRCPRRKWPCSDRICGPRESPWPGTRSGPTKTSGVRHSAKSNPTLALHNTIHNTIFNENFPSVKRPVHIECKM